MAEKERSPFYIHDQYIKDLSFENPNFLIKYTDNKKQPEIAINVETKTIKLHENNYEVYINVNAKSSLDTTVIFMLELSYAGIVSVNPDLTADILEPILMVHCPFLMYPFVREIVLNVTRNGGYQPLMLEPIDFASLYIDKRNAKNEEKKD
ncbi:MAG: protein-export chaperone SecB [Holosporales bacterium]|jgi:preprotein translocase subunit SecB|nr:protein-export chaperone SecB [Holosporales bacterium]